MRKTSREPHGGGVAALSSPSAEQISDLRVDNGPVMWKNTILTQGDTLRKNVSAYRLGYLSKDAGFFRHSEYSIDRMPHIIAKDLLYSFVMHEYSH